MSNGTQEPVDIRPGGVVIECEWQLRGSPVLVIADVGSLEDLDLASTGSWS